MRRAIQYTLMLVGVQRHYDNLLARMSTSGLNHPPAPRKKRRRGRRGGKKHRSHTPVPVIVPATVSAPPVQAAPEQPVISTRHMGAVEATFYLRPPAPPDARQYGRDRRRQSGRTLSNKALKRLQFDS